LAIDVLGAKIEIRDRLPSEFTEGGHEMKATRQAAPAHPHHVEHHLPDLSYRIVIRTVLWIIAGAAFVGLALWRVLT
jgi:hypothetical protein